MPPLAASAPAAPPLPAPAPPRPTPHAAPAAGSAPAPPSSRRAALAAVAASAVAVATLPPPRPAAAVSLPADLPAVTDTVYLDVGLCPEGYRVNRALGDANALCESPAPLGRIVIGLYGDASPGTVAQFKTLASSGDLDATLFHRVLPGEYVLAGRAGSRRMGELAPTRPLPPNPDLLTGSAFDGRHLRPGTVSLAVAASDDDDTVRLAPGYRAAQFLITTGPGPVPRLDGGNIVFGRVLSGLDVVTAMTRVPLLRAPPGPWASFAKLVGDERGARVAAKYGRPLKLIVITKAGVGEGT